MTESTTTERVMKRIRDLLAMANDTSSPNEAAIAARRARKLMDEHQVAELDLDSTDTEAFTTAEAPLGKKRQNSVTGSLAVSVAKLNDCVVSASRVSPTRMVALFAGFRDDVICAVEMLAYLQSERQRQAEYHTMPGSQRNAFNKGFSYGVALQVREALAEREKIQTRGATGTSLVVAKRALVEQKFGAPQYAKGRATSVRDANAWAAGVASGREASLHRQISSAP